MSFRDIDQRRRVCSALLRRVNLEDSDYFDGYPTTRLIETVEGAVNDISPGQLLMLRVVADVWFSVGHANDGARLGNLLDGTLTRENLRSVGKLIVAFAEGGDAVEAWLRDELRETLS